MSRGFALKALALLAVVAVAAAQVNYAKKQNLECDAKGSCSVSLGKAGKVKLPALVAFKTAHE